MPCSIRYLASYRWPPRPPTLPPGRRTKHNRPQPELLAQRGPEGGRLRARERKKRASGNRLLSFFVDLASFRSLSLFSESLGMLLGTSEDKRRGSRASVKGGDASGKRVALRESRRKKTFLRLVKSFGGMLSAPSLSLTERLTLFFCRRWQRRLPASSGDNNNGFDESHSAFHGGPRPHRWRRARQL